MSKADVLSVDRLPLEEAVHRQNAAAPAVGVAEHGSVPTVSHLALIGLRPPFGSAQKQGMRPQRNRSIDTAPVWRLRRITSSSWLGALFQRG
jgi:hypothetical protein